MIDGLKSLIEREIGVLGEISSLEGRMERGSPAEKKLLSEAVISLKKELKALNDSLPETLSNIMIEKKARGIFEKVGKAMKEKGEIRPSGESMVQKIEKREDYLRELEISEKLLKKLKRREKRKVEEVEEFKKARGYLKFSNKLFLKTSSDLAKKGYFRDLPEEIRKSNLDVLFETYLSMMLLSTAISFFLGIFLAILLMFVDFNIVWPLIALYDGSLLERFFLVIWLPFAFPLATFIALYLYPSAESKSIARRIDEEIPFAAIHMSSISGSGIEPTEIFKIIGLSRDYPYLKKEIRKVLNQINVYGYDLVTALNNVARSTSSTKLAELFSGLSTTINSGGSLSEFFGKRSESLLLNYKLEKERSIRLAETFMDIYISVVIAAPMILMLMLVMISISGIQIGFTPYQLTLMTIGGVAFINILFLGYLQLKQGS